MRKTYKWETYKRYSTVYGILYHTALNGHWIWRETKPHDPTKKLASNNSRSLTYKRDKKRKHFPKNPVIAESLSNLRHTRIFFFCRHCFFPPPSAMILFFLRPCTFSSKSSPNEHGPCSSSGVHTLARKRCYTNPGPPSLRHLGAARALRPCLTTWEVAYCFNLCLFFLLFVYPSYYAAVRVC